MVLVREEAEAVAINAQEKAEQEAATAEQARSAIVAQVQVQIAAGDATNQFIAKMQIEQRDQLERTRLLHEAASDSNAKIEGLSSLLAGQAQLLKNLEGTVGAPNTGLTTLTASVSDIAKELRAFIASNKQTRSNDDGPTSAGRNSDHSPSRQRSPRRQTGDGARSDPGGTN